MVYTFACPLCGKRYRSVEPGEPVCTGPSESRDDHELVVMRLAAIDRDAVNPARAEERASGALLLPDMLVEVARDARVMLAK